ncbi:SDR family oxidoreductase [Myxococcota bacterium]|nr:SDR family oxidoreductase [Myxococcota bacterium]
MGLLEANDLILLTGATGYVGGRLMRRFEAEGRALRCLVRRPEQFRGHSAETTEICPGDATDRESVARALAGVETAYYLVHSMGAREDFEVRDRLAATIFAQEAARAGVARIVYLGGLGDSRAELSAHLRSRHEVGRILAASGVPTIELRASIVIGSGSLSFELIRSLVERLPAMITPRWVGVLAQPIAIDDVLDYLVASRDVVLAASRVYEIGGPDRVSYGDLMREYAGQRGLHRIMISVPVLTPRLSSLWLRIVTPIYAEVGRKLIDSICHPTCVEDESALRDFAIRPVGVREAISRALRSENRELAVTRWSDALSSAAPPRTWGGRRLGNRLLDMREITVAAPAERAFAPIRRIGGAVGWYAFDGLWRLRGLLDLLVGGVGLRRGRRDPERLRVGDPLDWWRVEVYEPDRRLGLVAEMKLPGRAWLEFEVEPVPGGTRIRQTATFEPAGLAGLAYWYGIYPLHALVFRGMIRGMARRVTDGGGESVDHRPTVPAIPPPRTAGRET